jgi:hypothetical protein
LSQSEAEKSTSITDEDARLLRIANWVEEGCLLWGTTIATARMVGALFLEGLERERNSNEKPTAG